MAEHYFTVGIHGAPTPETAPHGYFWRRPSEGLRKWTFYDGPVNAPIAKDAEWYVPAPPTEQAPPPEPVKRWDVKHLGCGYGRVCHPDGAELTMVEAIAAKDALNALDRDGVAWGPGRPMDELPDDQYVAYRTATGVWVDSSRAVRNNAQMVVCWWPLPLPGEAR